ncbi:MAG: NmrA/HSCARG family protein [Saccharothrix sp.]|nr:NmrA/HSCARG family protein [Saccharothrix sp.]
MDLVVVTGATGRQGGAVARHLLASGRRVRALTRDPDSPAARALARLGAEVVRGDMADRDSLRPVFVGAHGVYSVQNPMISGLEAEVHQGRTVGDAAAEAGVEHFVYGSAGTGKPGTGVGSWESKLAVQAHLESLGLPLTVLRPMAFMELMTDKGYYPPVSTWHLMPKLMGEDRPVLWLSVDDLGAVAARVFAEPERFVGADLELTSEVLTIRECRALWTAVFGRAPRRFPMPVWMFEKFVGDDLTTMWRWLRTHPTDVDPARTREIVPDARTVRQWLVERRA